MLQDSLWATAPIPRSLGCNCSYAAATNDYTVTFDLHYSAAFEGKPVHILLFNVELIERDAVQSMHWAADRYFWRHRYPRIVEREIRKSLQKYRDYVDTTRIPTSGFHEVDFG